MTHLIEIVQKSISYQEYGIHLKFNFIEFSRNDFTKIILEERTSSCDANSSFCDKTFVRLPKEFLP